MRKQIILLILGVVIFALGGYQNVQYEEKAIVVQATITRIKTKEDTDSGPISYGHTYYGEYTVDGKKYTDKKLNTLYNSSHIPQHAVGQTMEIRVDPDSPGKQVAEGGLLIMGGMGLIIYASVKIHKIKKKARLAAEQPHQI